MTDTKTVTLSGSLPRAYLAVTAPLDGDETIDSTLDLPVSWQLVETSPCVVSMTCGTLAFWQAVDVALDDTFLDEQVALADGASLLPAPQMAPGRDYAIATIAADASFSSETTDLGDDVEVLQGYGEVDEISFKTVPEPSVSHLAGAALVVLALLRRRTRSGASRRRRTYEARGDRPR